MNGKFLKNILKGNSKMGTSREDIKEWFVRGKKQKATHLIVVCDTYDHEDYPVFVTKHQDAKTEVNNRDGHNMARVMEVYNLSKDMEEQLNLRRCFEF